MTFDDVLRAINVLAGGLAAGVMLTTLVGQIPTVRALGPAVAREIKLLWDPGIDRVVPPLLLLSIVTAAVILAAADVLSTAATVLTAAGMASMIGAAAVSVAVGIPLEKAMHAVPPGRAGTEFEPLLARWCRVHELRTTLALAGFGAFAVALIAGPGESWDLADGVRLVGVLAAGGAAGIQVSGLFGQIPAVKALPQPQALATKQIADRHVDHIAPVAVSLCPLCGVALLVIGSSGTADGLTIAGLVAYAAVVIPTVTINVPINLRMRGWSTEAVPPEFTADHERWVAAHRIRMVASIVGFACYAAAAIAGIYG
ncbi:MAG: anthrone oxygenase family protein [Solirubrobacteraceae bacterium]